MSPSYRQLRFGEQVEIDATAGGAQMVGGSGRAVSATVRGGASAWLPLYGLLHLETSEGTARVAPGSILLWNESQVRVSPRSAGLWLTLAAPMPLWQSLLSRTSSALSADQPLLYPGEYACPTALKRLLVRLGRCARRGESAIGNPRALLEASGVLLSELQQPVDALTERCAGHTLARRRQVLLRLLRACNRVRMNPTDRIDLASLARSANYSPWHFIRAFRDVFGETPCDYATRIRLEHAKRLIETDQLTVTEAANLAGYDSRSGFCRSFRHAFGMTASDARRAAVG